MTHALDEDRYADLLHETKPHVVRTEADNENALRAIERLMARGEDLTPEESELLALFVALVEQFEGSRYALPAADPAQVLHELMNARGLRQRDVVELFPSKGVASEVLSGKRAISKTQAKRLGEFFGVSPAVFI